MLVPAAAASASAADPATRTRAPSGASAFRTSSRTASSSSTTRIVVRSPAAVISPHRDAPRHASPDPFGLTLLGKAAATGIEVEPAAVAALSRHEVLRRRAGVCEVVGELLAHHPGS